MILLIVHVVIVLIFIARVMLRPHRDPASRIAWVAVIAALPYLGVVINVLFGAGLTPWAEIRLN